jgi:hypothetical protein
VEREISGEIAVRSKAEIQAGICKAMQVAAGIALPKDVRIALNLER